MLRLMTVAGIALASAAALAQETNGTNPIFWCDMSRSQVSHERDAGLAQIEILKLRNAQLEAKVKDMEAKAKQASPEKETAPNE